MIAISALSRGLDQAQKTALNPLSSIGTDLTVTLAPRRRTRAAGFVAAASGRGGGFGGTGQVTQANQSAVTDLSKLGKPGTKFVHDFFLPGTQLTFPQSQTKQIAALSGVSAVSSGLVLSAVHQSGTVPKIVAKIKTGGQRSTSPGASASGRPGGRAANAACFAKLVASTGDDSGPTTPSAGAEQQAAAPSAAAAMAAAVAAAASAASPRRVPEVPPGAAPQLQRTSSRRSRRSSRS